MNYIRGPLHPRKYKGLSFFLNDFCPLETLLYQSLRAENDNHNLGFDIFFWRTSDGREVDFVLYGERGLHAFEIRRSSRFREADLAALRLFCEDYPEAKAHLLYGGTQRYRFGPIEVLPFGPIHRRNAQLRGACS